MKSRILFKGILLSLLCIIVNFSTIAQSSTNVSGVVSDPDGSPLLGVTVLEKGTSNGVITDVDGKYEISVASDATLSCSFIGMSTVEIPINGQKVINITMEDNKVGLDELIVIGYGVARKSDLTGAVASVDAKKLENIPNSRIDQVMQGRAAGVQITQTSGQPGAGTVIRIRGGNSIEGSNEPLWVIDGVIVGNDFDLNNLNSNDVKSIEILKDASSIAIYGSRGANGVVLVTTKSGTSIGGKPKVNVGLSSSMQLVPERPEYLSQAEQIAYTNESAVFRSAAAPFPNDPSTYPDNDWFNMLMEPSPIYNADVSINGSSESGNVNYYNSINYFNQDGLIKNSGLDKFVFRSNIDIKLSKITSVGFRINYSRIHRDNGTVSYSSLLASLRTQPAYNEDGSYNGWNDVIGNPFSNPLANAAYNINETYSNNLLSTAYLQIQPNEKWIIRSTFSPEIDNVKTNKFYSSKLPNYIVVGETGSASVNGMSSLGWNNENTVQYTTKINDDHSITALAGASFQKYTEEGYLAEAYGITSDATTFNNLALGSDPTRNIIGSDYDGFQVASFFGRLNYAYKSKYLFTLVGRTDGASRFAAGNRYEFYPSVAGAWRISEESFMKDVSFVSNLKLRSSYGKSGSQSIQSYRTLGLLDQASTTYNGTLYPGVVIGRPENKNLKWETTTQLDIALEVGLFDNKVFGEFNYYRKQTDDLLLNVSLPAQTGDDGMLQNVGSLENKGWEFLLTTTNVKTSDFSWGSTLTLSSNKNKVLDLGPDDYIDVVVDNIIGSGNTRIIVGEPLPVFTGVRYLGTWKSQEEINNSTLNPVNQVVGGAHFEDLNGDGIISTDDNVVLGSPQADVIFGLENTFTYKNFDLSFFFQGTYGNEVYNMRSVNDFLTRGEQTKYKELVDRWTTENPTSDIPRAGSDAVTSIPSNSLYVEDGSHIRLKNLRLVYNVPTKRLGWTSVDRMSVYFSGTNLFIASKFRLIDPETSRYGKDGIGNIAQGYSHGEYPNAKVLSLGLNISF